LGRSSYCLNRLILLEIIWFKLFILFIHLLLSKWTFNSFMKTKLRLPWFAIKCSTVGCVVCSIDKVLLPSGRKSSFGRLICFWTFLIFRSHNWSLNCTRWRSCWSSSLLLLIWLFLILTRFLFILRYVIVLNIFC